MTAKNFKILKSSLRDFKVDERKEYRREVMNLGSYKFMTNRKQSISAYFDFDGSNIFGYNFEKHRKVVERKPRKPGSKKSESIIIEKPYWIITQYVFPIERVKYFRQFPRHFKVIIF